jgi:excisionase family DNA binding protein
VNLELPDSLLEEIARRAAALVVDQLDAGDNGASPYLTIPEAAELLRVKRHRVDDLLSKGVLSRVDGSRTLVAREELERYLQGRPTGRRAR